MQSLAHVCDDVYDLAVTALDNGALREDILGVAEDMARLRCLNATELRDKANGR